VALWTQGTLNTRFVRGVALRADSSFAINNATQPSSYTLHAAPGHYVFSHTGPGGADAKRYEPKSLEQLVSVTNGSTGLWGAPVQYAASLLFADELSMSGLAQLANPVTEAVEPIGENWCLRIRAESSSGALLTLWVDRESWLLRRLSHDTPVGDIHRRVTVEYHSVAVGVDIAPGEVAPP